MNLLIGFFIVPILLVVAYVVNNAKEQYEFH